MYKRQEFHREVLGAFVPGRLMEQLRHRHFYRVQSRGESLAQFVHSIRDTARTLGLGLSEEEVVQIILEGVSPQERLRLVFAERPRRFVDLDRLCVMSKDIQTSDEARGDSSGDLPISQRAEGRSGPSRPRQAQSVRDRESWGIIICYNCNRPGHVAPVSYTHLDVYKRQVRGEDILRHIFP